jgi:ATP-dependent DNA ligase
MIGFGFAPMEMRSVTELPRGEQWQYEPKWDGFRCLAFYAGGELLLQSKSGQHLERYFPEMVAALASLRTQPFVLDGELVLRQEGTTSFELLQQRIHPAASRVTMLAREFPASYEVFDLLADGEEEFVALPLVERRAALERFATAFDGERLRLSPATRSLERAQAWLGDESGLDGVVAKRSDLPYASGSRDAAVKVKHLRTLDCVVGGFRYAKDSNDRVGSLLLGLYDERGLLDHIGFCSAFAVAERRALLERLLPLRGGPGFTGSAPDAAPSRWTRDRSADRSYVALEHVLVLEVQYDQATSGRIRHGARPVRWRSDKSPASCTFEQLVPRTQC